MILRSNTVVQLQPGTRINLAGTVDPLALSGAALARLLHDEGYATMAGLTGGFLHGAYMELVSDTTASAEDGSVVPLARGAWIFALPGTVVTTEIKADGGKAGRGRASFGLGFALGVGVFAGLMGLAVGDSRR
jgi:hypothetical protein